MRRLALLFIAGLIQGIAQAESFSSSLVTDPSSNSTSGRSSYSSPLLAAALKSPTSSYLAKNYSESPSISQYSVSPPGPSDSLYSAPPVAQNNPPSFRTAEKYAPTPYLDVIRILKARSIVPTYISHGPIQDSGEGSSYSHNIPVGKPKNRDVSGFPGLVEYKKYIKRKCKEAKLRKSNSLKKRYCKRTHGKMPSKRGPKRPKRQSLELNHQQYFRRMNGEFLTKAAESEEESNESRSSDEKADSQSDESDEKQDASDDSDEFEETSDESEETSDESEEDSGEREVRSSRNKAS